MFSFLIVVAVFIEVDLLFLSSSSLFLLVVVVIVDIVVVVVVVVVLFVALLVRLDAFDLLLLVVHLVGRRLVVARFVHLQRAGRADAANFRQQKSKTHRFFVFKSGNCLGRTTISVKEKPIVHLEKKEQTYRNSRSTMDTTSSDVNLDLIELDR